MNEDDLRIPREVMITCTLFIVVLFLSTGLIHVYGTGKVVKITGASVQDVPRAPFSGSGGAGGYWFNYLVKNNESNESNKITGAVTVEKELMGYDPGNSDIIGQYTYNPTFTFTSTYNVEESYSALRKEILDFESFVDDCKNSGELTDTCIEEAMQNFTGWYYGYACEEYEESVYYDSVDMFQDCLFAPGTDCLCAGSVDPAVYLSFAISIETQDEISLFAMQNSDLDPIVVEVPIFEGIMENLNGEKELIKSMLYDYELDDTTAKSGVYLYKDFDGITVLSEDDFDYLVEQNKSYCTQEKVIHSFCYVSGETVTTWSEDSGLKEDQPIIYEFSLIFDDDISLAPRTPDPIPVTSELLTLSVEEETEEQTETEEETTTLTQSFVPATGIKNVISIGTSTTSHGGYVDYLNIALNDYGITFRKQGYSGSSSKAIRDCLLYGQDCDKNALGHTVETFDIDDYDTITILAGLNDGLCSGDPQTTISNLQAMYNYAKGKGMTVIALTMTPARAWFDKECKAKEAGGEHSVEYTEEVNEWILSVPENVDYVVDVNPIINDGNGYIMDEYTSDGLHPNDEAHEKMGEEIYNTLFAPTLIAESNCIILYGDTQVPARTPHTDVVNAIEDENCGYYYLFHVGDMVNYGTDSDDWEQFLVAEKDLINKGKIYPVVGNHEVLPKADSSTFGVTEILAGIGSSFPYLEEMLGDYGWYTEDITNNLVLIGLNNGIKYNDYTTFITTYCIEQEAFLRTKLEQNKGKDIIVSYHAPAFPLLEGRYEGDPCAVNYWHDVIKEYSSESKIVVISGHTHGLSYAEKDGIVYLEVGAANEGLSEDCRESHEVSVDDYGDCKVSTGYFICDIGMNKCYAKNTEDEILFSVDLSMDTTLIT